MSFQVIVHNVGHGHSIHAFTPLGQTMVVDLGCSSDFSPLKWLKKSHPTIDMLFISHPHGDHIDEILELNNLGFYVRQIWHPKHLTKQEVEAANQFSYRDKVSAYFSLSKKYVGFVQPHEDMRMAGATGGLSTQFFVSSTCGRSNINNHSGVLVFEYLGIKIIVPGDNEPPSWRTLLENPKFVSTVRNADIFVASHHGRESGYCSEALNVISPRLCVISDGRVQDTDATSRYSYHASGLNVKSRNQATTKQRYCVTTRSDGFVDIKVSQGLGFQRPNLSVEVD